MIIYTLLIIFAVASRLLPHLPNFTPITALALFTSVTALERKSQKERLLAYALPIVSLLISDLIIGFYTWPVMVSVYLGFGIVSLIGIAIRKYNRFTYYILASILGSVIFYLVTNAAVWAFTPMYVKSLSGLMESYTAALPFLRNSFLGDLTYTFVIFGLYEIARSKIKDQRLRINTIKLKEEMWLS